MGIENLIEIVDILANLCAKLIGKFKISYQFPFKVKNNPLGFITHFERNPYRKTN